MQPSTAHNVSLSSFPLLFLFLNAREAISVCSGVLPGATQLGCAGSSEKYAARFCSTTPVAPAVAHEPNTPYSELISAAALPCASTAAMNTVSPRRLPCEGTLSHG